MLKTCDQHDYVVVVAVLKVERNDESIYFYLFWIYSTYPVVQNWNKTNRENEQNYG